MLHLPSVGALMLVIMSLAVLSSGFGLVILRWGLYPRVCSLVALCQQKSTATSVGDLSGGNTVGVDERAI